MEVTITIMKIDGLVFGGNQWVMPSLGVLIYLKNKKSICQKVQIQKRVRKMDFGNDSATFGGGCLGGCGGIPTVCRSRRC